MASTTVTDALSVLSTVLTTVSNSVAQATQISQIIAGAQAQGRTELNSDEWAIINSAQASTRAALVEAIKKALEAA